MAHDILCVGHTNWDIILHSDAIPDPDYSEKIRGEHKSSGGSAANTASVLSSFGENVRMLGGIGADKYGDKVENALKENGVTPELQVGDVPTTVVYVVITENASPRYFAKNEEVSEFDIDDIPQETWDKIDHVHTTSFHETRAGELAQKAKQEGKTVSFNPSQGYGDRGPFQDLVDAADVIFLNDDREAEMFRNWHTLGEVASEKIVVITHGSAGSTLYSPEGVFNHSGFATDEEVRDTVGAGDSFAAGFLHEWLNGGDLDKALQMANATGARSVEKVGAPDSLDSDRTRQLLENED